MLCSVGEPTDNPDGKVRVERMGDSPELVPTGLPDPLEGGGLLRWLGWQIGESLQQCDRRRQESAALLLDVRKPAIELLRPVDDHGLIISSKLYNAKVVLKQEPARRAGGARGRGHPRRRYVC